MRMFALLVVSVISAAAAESDMKKLWDNLAEKRLALKSFHQEFEVTFTSKTANRSQGYKRTETLDIAGGVWRVRSVSGSGNDIRIFDGTDIFYMDEGGDEYVRTKHKVKEGDETLPAPYSLNLPNWAKASEVRRHTCGLPGVTHECVILDIPLKASMRQSGNHLTKRFEGNERIDIDTVSGLLVQARIVQGIDTGRSEYLADTAYVLRRVGYGMAMDAGLFKVPEGANEVKELSRWDAPKIKKMLAGATAPALSVRDIHGNALTLADLKGKTVLLDFWTTWCPPCRADAPSIDKLYQKYGGKELAVVGISVSEEREVVEKFLSEHPHEFPIILTSENEMPRPYQIGIFPTYIVIEKDGTVASAVQGEKGFADLKSLLKKAGLESE